MSESLGYLAVIQVSDDAGSNYYTIGEVKDPTFTIDQDLHDVTSNSDGIYKTQLRGHKQATLAFTCNYDEADTGQIKMLDAIINGTATKWKVRPNGSGAGNEEYLFDGDFPSQEITMTTQGPKEFPVTVNSTGTITKQTQT